MATSDVIKIPAISEEYIFIAYASDEDPTSEQVFFAATSTEETQPSDPSEWISGVWNGSQIFMNMNDAWKKCWVARVKFSLPDGPGDLLLAKADHFIWFRRVSIDESIVRPVGWVRIY